MKSTENSANSIIDSVPFTVDRGALWRTLMLMPRKAWPVWLTAAVAVCLLIAGIFSSLPLMMVGLLMLFTVFPASASFLFLTGITSKGIVPNIVPHTVTRLPDGWRVDMFRKSVAADEDGTETVTWEPCGSLTVAESDVTKAIDTIEYDILFIRNSSLSLLFIPR
ncbi:MAG: hypothetical protein K2K93_04910 [Muribaculaceae bacterium]|nr:hypothetical protein [Muribaculaceae bacterium]